MESRFPSLREHKTRYLLAICFAFLTVLPLGPVHAQTTPEDQTTIDLQTDNNDDGLPDALVAQIAHLQALSDMVEDGSDIQAATTLDAAMAGFTERLPYSEQTRAAQAEAEALMTHLNAPHSEAEDEAIWTQLREIEGRMLADPNFALATDALKTLFLRQLHAKAVADGAQFVVADASDGANAAAITGAWPTTKGDIMFINSNSGAPNFIYAMGFSHIGTFNGNADIYDSNKGKGVLVQQLSNSNWEKDKSLIAYAYNNQKSISQVQGALQWAKNRYGTDGTTGYSLLMTRDKADDSNYLGSGYRVYCSQLVWKIHDHISSNLDSDHPTIRAFLKAYWGSVGEQVAINGVAPDEIAMDSNITFYKWISPQGNDSPKIYIPDVRLQHNEWRTRLVVRNNSNADTTVRVVITDDDGVILNTVVKEGIKPNAGWSINLEEGGLHGNNIRDMYGAATVFAGADVSAVAYHKRRFSETKESFTSYAGVESPQTTVHIPLIQRGNTGWYNYIAIQNTDLNSSANVTLNFTPSTAGSSCTKSYTLPARGHLLLNTKDNGSGITEFSCLGSKFVGAVKITASRPLAVAYTQYLNSGETLVASSNSANTGGNAYAPVIQNQNSGYTSGFSLLNASNSYGSPAATYYDTTGQCANSSYSVNGNHSVIVYPAPPSGNNCESVNSARFNGNGKQIGVQVNQIKPGTYQGSDYPAITQPGNTIVAPILWKDWDGYSSGLAIQNTDASWPANVTITYYHLSSGSKATSESVTIQPNQTATIYPIKPGYFQGSAVISSNRPIAVVVNHLDGLSGGMDGLASHIGLKQ